MTCEKCKIEMEHITRTPEGKEITPFWRCEKCGYVIEAIDTSDYSQG